MALQMTLRTVVITWSQCLTALDFADWLSLLQGRRKHPREHACKTLQPDLSRANSRLLHNS